MAAPKAPSKRTRRASTSVPHPADHGDGVIGGSPSERDAAVADTDAVVEGQSRKRRVVIDAGLPASKVSPLLVIAREVAVELGGPTGKVNVTALAAAVVASGRTNLKGKTPAATVGAHVYVAARKGLVFRKVDGERGMVELVEAVSS